MRLVALLAVVGVAGCASTRPTLTPSEKLEHAVRRCNEQLAEVQRTAVPELQPYHTLRPDRVDWYVPSNDDPTGPIVLPLLGVNISQSNPDERAREHPPRYCDAALPDSPAKAPWRDSRIGLGPAGHGALSRSFSMTDRGWAASVDINYDMNRFTSVLPRLFAVLEQCTKDFPDADQAAGKEATP